ncbi:MAG: response regulator transcription factor [Alphaproteobacteria bacterium]|nr:response regulator transcription factor [Alphaproteobacteria bacterium]
MEKYEVLIVDDDADFSESLIAALSRMDVEARTAQTPADAKFMLRNKAYDCIICDYQLGNVNGIDLFPEFRAIAQATPIVMLTGHGGVPTAVKALHSGAMDFLEKPVTPEALMQAIVSAVEGSKASAELQGLIEEARHALEQLSLRERSVVQDLASGFTSRQIATKFGTSPRTIESHRSNILAKLHIKNTAALVRLAVLAKLPGSN